MRSDLNLFLRHDQRAIEQCEIADGALPVIADRKRTARVKGSMFTNNDCARFFASEKSKNLCTLAIKTFAKLHVRRDRFLPPILFNVSVFFNVAHGIVAILSAAKNL